MQLLTSADCSVSLHVIFHCNSKCIAVIPLQFHCNFPAIVCSEVLVDHPGNKGDLNKPLEESLEVLVGKIRQTAFKSVAQLVVPFILKRIKMNPKFFARYRICCYTRGSRSTKSSRSTRSSRRNRSSRSKRT